MKWFNRIRTRLLALVGRDRVIADIDEEFRLHVELETRTNIERGMAPDEARRAAVRSFGNVGSARDLAYQVRGGGAMESILQDLRYGRRMLTKNLSSTLTIVFILTLGIGANTAAFSVLNAVLLRRLPIADPGRVAVIHDRLPKLNLPRAMISPPQSLDYSRQTAAFELSAAIYSRNLTMTGVDTPLNVTVGRVTSTFFPLLGVKPITGRYFTDEEDRYGAGHVVVLSNTLWRRLFHSDSHVVGQSVRFYDQPYQIVGVAPESLAELYPDTDVWIPAAWAPAELSENRRWSLYVTMLARLKPGVGFAQAQSLMDGVAQGINPDASEFGIEVRPLTDEKIGDVRKPLFLSFCAVAVVLLICCLNVAGLLLARGVARTQEIAIRSALGAGKGRIARQLLIESLMIAAVSGGLGLIVGVLGTRAVVAIAPDNLPRLAFVRADSSVLLFTFVVSLACGVVFGLAPAIVASKTDLVAALKDSVRTGSGHIGGRLRGLLVVSEVALAMAVLIFAGLLVRSFEKVLAVNPGYQANNVLTARIALPGKQSRQSDVAAFYNSVIERVSSLPEVTSAAIAYQPPLMECDNSVFEIRDQQAGPGDPEPHADYAYVSAGYMRAMGIPLVNGRDFESADFKSGGISSVIIDEALAKRFWPNSDPIGAEVRFGDWAKIVGVAATVHQRDLVEEPEGTIYFPGYALEGALVVRSPGDPRALIPAIRQAVFSVDKAEPIYDVRPMDERLSQALAGRRFIAVLLSVFAGVALLLAAVGLYGMIGYTVSQRTQEIGIRMALGARAKDVLLLIVGQGALLAALGSGLGVIVAYFMSSAIAGFLFGVMRTDLATFFGLPALLLAVALISSYLPARRAARLDPMKALRSE